MRILLVDNDVEFLEIRSECLRYAGHEVVTAATIPAVHAALRAGPFTVVIIDVRLQDDNDDKDRSGLRLAQELAAAIPKIILTGYPSEDVVAEALRSRQDGRPLANDFVSKEDGSDALLEAVRRLGAGPAV